MTRKECLEQAMECVLKDRASQYGTPEDNFGRIAKLWSTYTGTVLDGIDVAMMMALLKVARIRNNKDYSDGYIDLAGYAACGAELAGKAEAYRQSIEKAGAEYKRLRAEAEGDAKAEDCEEAEFKRGDAVEWNSVGRGWLPAVYLREFGDFGHCAIQIDGRERIVCKVDLRRPEANYPENPDGSKRAEGCEELVQKDAPQTAQELYDRILSCNPATYGKQSTPEDGMAEIHRRLMMGENVSLKCPAPRTPTGEELAEMAEEMPHG